jgi:hypothetical protein
MGVEHVGYYPDQLFDNHPNPSQIRSVLGLKPNLPEVP